jgi:hypothetical protein
VIRQYLDAAVREASEAHHRARGLQGQELSAAVTADQVLAGIASRAEGSRPAPDQLTEFADSERQTSRPMAAATRAGNYVDAAAYGITWARAREHALTRTERISRLAKRLYDLRHAGISFWLYSGVDPAECARRAGQSIEVLFRHYAKSPLRQIP